MNKTKRQEVYDKYNGHCAYCGKEIKIEDMQVDHISPKSYQFNKNADDMENLNPSCRRCNHYKRAHTLETFRAMIGTLPYRIETDYITKVAIDFGIVKFENWDGKFYFEKMCEVSIK